MHHGNHFYGHAHIMSRYVGLAYPPRIWGYLHPYRVVAAPWVYLLDIERQAEWEKTAPEREGTIVYPFHGWEGQQVLGSHASFVEEIKDAEGDVPITVCLHWNEYDNDEVRAIYENAGVRVITHGERGYLWQGTDTEFLYKQLTELRRHKRVVSNRMSSALLYAATAGAEIGIYGDPMVLESDHAVLGGVEKPWRLWPEMHQFAVPREIALEVAQGELGLADKMLPEEVIEAFGWGPEFEYQASLPPELLPQPEKERRGLRALLGEPDDYAHLRDGWRRPVRPMRVDVNTVPPLSPADLDGTSAEPRTIEVDDSHAHRAASHAPVDTAGAQDAVVPGDFGDEGVEPTPGSAQ